MNRAPPAKALAGLLMAGALGACSAPQPAAPAAPAASTAPAADAGRAWESFWTAIGDGFVPELPLADLPAAKSASEALGRAEPAGWRSGLATAQLELLGGSLSAARAAVERAASRCGDAGCAAATAVLRALVITEQHTTFERAVHLDALRSKGLDVDVEGLGKGARAALPRVPAPLRRAAWAWHAASRVRFIRAGFRSLHYFITPGDADRFDAEAARQLDVVGDDPVVRVLRWSLNPAEPPPETEGRLRAAAALLRAEWLLAPNGGVMSADVHVLGGPPDRITWYTEGLPPPLERAPSAEEIAAARALLADDAAFGAGTLLEPQRALTLAFLDLDEGRTADARARIDRAEARLRGPGAPATAAGAAVLSAAAHLVDGRVGPAMTEFQRGLELTERAGAFGRSVAVLGAMAALAEQVFHLGQRYADGVALTEKATDLAIEHGYLDQAVRLATTSVDLVDALSLPQEQLRLAPRSHRALDAAVQGYQRYGAAQKLKGGAAASLVDQSILSISSVRAGLASQEAAAMAQLGAPWSEVEERLQVFSEQAAAGGLLGVGGASSALVDRLRVTLRIFSYVAQGDAPAAIAAARGDRELRELIAAAQGYPADPAVLEAQLREREQALAAATAGQGPLVGRYLDAMLHRQDLASRRERYIGACERLRSAREARRVLEAWRADPFSSAIARSQPYRAQILEAQVLAAEGKRGEAAAAYERAIGVLRARLGEGQRRDRHRATMSALAEGYGGRARVALEARDALTALDRVDELRWLRDEQEGGSGRPLAPPPLELDRIAQKLGGEAAVVMLADVGIPGSVQGFVWSRRGGLRTRAFPAAASGMGLSRALELVSSGGAPEGPARSLAEWLGRETQRDRPLVLAVSANQRAAGLHLLPVAGEPLSLRNPLLYAPSLRALGALFGQQPNAGGDRLVVGVPVTADTSRTAIGEVVPVGSEAELRALAAERLLWDQDATVPAVSAAMARARRIHVSSHGRASWLDAAGTGLVLSGGEVLSPGAASQLSLASPLVVLSACMSGLQVHPSASGVPALDRAFLFAGARAVISTPWEVPADAAAAWMRALHDGLDRGLTVMEAARRAYASTRKGFPQATSWGAFSIVGAGEGPA
ncbi:MULTISPECIES: CHAT domain-containing protein [Sorangium]|uniref:CHAT domain-containing protein n=1 Tax=Sorangium cellulosum TaxID=56 RepID=A0A4P2QTQ4_SORCE|nr:MULTISPECIES: CHAT domain-containing protein [Sorangium]AUX33518.1 uncharacterized protein SOCE836_056780 [Sorangium cellulosum]WCQ92834.1 hypothetical protein NQZ70_05580 [Sorangium sp. Soce836]